MTSLPPSPNTPVLPHGYTLRPAALADLETVLGLRAAQNQADYGQAGLTASYLQDSWQVPAFQVGQDHWLVYAPDGQAVAYGEVRGEAGDYEAILAVDPTGRVGAEAGASLALSLLACIDRRAAELAGAQRCQITCRVSTRNAAARQWVETCGFRPGLTFHIMEASLAQAPAAPALPIGVRIRTFVPGQDDQAVYRADEESGEDKGYHQPLSYEAWCGRMGRHTALFDPGLWFLALVGDELAGAALNFYHPETHTAWVDHLGVRRAFRCRGIGMALLAQSLLVFHQRGYPLARLSVDSHSLTHAPRLYEKAGFQTVLGYHIYRK